MTHILVNSAVSWGPRYATALTAVLEAWKNSWQGEIPAMRGDRTVLVQEFMKGNLTRPLVLALIYHIKDSQLDDLDVEDMLLEYMEEHT